MKRVALAGLVLASLTLSAPYALAQDPPTAACLSAETDLAVAVATRDDALEAQSALAVDGDLGATPEEVARLEAVIVADPDREAELRPRIVAIEAVLAAESAVADAETARDEACLAPVETPAPTTPAAPVSDVPLDSGLPDDDDFDQVGQVPVGGVATGG